LTRRRALLVLLLAAPVIVQAALGPRYGGELRIGAIGPSGSLDPHSAAGPTGRMLLAMVHETLVRAGADGPVPGLAETWVAGRDGRDWTLELAGSLQFHDGSEVTAADAVRAVQRFLRSGSPSAAVLAQSLEATEALDARRIVLKFRVAVSPWSLLPLASPAAAVVSARGAACGPFVPSLTTGDELLFVAFGAHVRGRPYVDRARVRLVPEARRLLADRRLERVDLAVGSPGRPHAPGLLVLALNTTRPPFDSRKRRLAVAAAIDRDALAGRTLVDALPWSRLLVDSDATPAPSIRAGRPEAAPRAPVALILAVDRTLPRLASQRIVAHLADIGLAPQVLPVDPETVRDVPADARLMLFEPELSEPVLALHELASIVETADVPVAAMEADPRARQAMALEIEQRLLGAAALIPLARLSRSTDAGPHVQGLRTEGHTVHVEDAWTLP
jgi:hypothetical protein